MVTIAITAGSVIAYLCGWVGCAIWWTRTDMAEYVRDTPDASRRMLERKHQDYSNQDTALALAWPVLIWFALGCIVVPELVRRYSRHPLMQKDLRELEGKRK